MARARYYTDFFFFFCVDILITACNTCIPSTIHASRAIKTHRYLIVPHIPNSPANDVTCAIRADAFLKFLKNCRLIFYDCDFN